MPYADRSRGWSVADDYAVTHAGSRVDHYVWNIRRVAGREEIMQDIMLKHLNMLCRKV